MSDKVVVGVMKCVLRVADSHSLKSKRQVVGGVIRRVRNEFPVAVAEVGELDRWQLADVAIACVSGDAVHAQKVLDSVVRYMSRSDAEVTDIHVEMLRV